MGFDMRRCAEAAVHAALAEAFTPPAPGRAGRGKRRRFRPLRLLLRLVRLALLAIGAATTTRVALDPERRRAGLTKLAERFPIDDLLEEIAVEVAAARAALADADEQAGASEAEAAAEKPVGPRQRRPVSRSRGDTNGQRGRKPPNRGTRAA
jgi:hypothetical protein